MANKMLIDATHPEETRVVVLRGNRVEEFDFESAQRKQLRGNIYLAKVTRVEPSLQAAFVDYGGNRHGFLAFSEIHPDYYQIPVADRQALLDEEERAARAADDEDDRRARGRHRQRNSRRRPERVRSAPADALTAEEAAREATENPAGDTPADAALEDAALETGSFDAAYEGADATGRSDDDTQPVFDAPTEGGGEPTEDHSDADSDQPHLDAPSETPGPDTERSFSDEGSDQPMAAEGGSPEGAADQSGGGNVVEINGNGSETEEVVKSVGGSDAMEEVPERMPRSRRQYKIQEVIKRRQVMLVQVVKEERGTKGAALTTYLSLAGRYSVLMPNTARGGGISRKITDAVDRRRLKEVAQELEVPEGMGVILRTAGANRTKTEVKRDFEYLLRMWETVRDLTLRSTAPTLVYEEGSLVKRSIRDLYNKDIDEVLVAGDDAYKEAKDFMRMLMPSHAKNVKAYKDAQPLFTRTGIESQLDAMFQPIVQLRSGGYIVLNQAEALVAIDVNSGRATREHHIEDTALKTNMEAAEEIARQLRLRDLAGLVVIDFIDMDEKRNNRTVERRMKESLKHDRARIQVGHISHFGLLEMSRQRIRSSVLESSTEKCPHCGGTGHMRSVSSVALQLLRTLEETLLKGATHNLVVRTRTDIALYVLNHKRAHLRDLEERFRITLAINADATVSAQQSFVIDKGEQVHTIEQARAIAAQSPSIAPVIEEEDDIVEAEAEAEIEDTVEVEVEADAEADEEADAEDQAAPDRRPEGERGGRRRRRRGRGGEGRSEGRVPRPPMREPSGEGAPMQFEGDQDTSFVGENPQSAEGNGAAQAEHQPPYPRRDHEQDVNGNGRKRRRGRRGGRRNRRGGREGEFGERLPGDEMATFEAPGQDVSEPDPRTQMAMAHTVEAYEPRADLGEPADSPVETAAPAPAPLEHDPEPAPAPQPPRRRSTVREPAPVFGAEGWTPPSPPALPPEPEPAAFGAAAGRQHERGQSTAQIGMVEPQGARAGITSA